MKEPSLEILTPKEEWKFKQDPKREWWQYHARIKYMARGFRAFEDTAAKLYWNVTRLWWYRPIIRYKDNVEETILNAKSFLLHKEDANQAEIMLAIQ
jgi:hypothetical protein